MSSNDDMDRRKFLRELGLAGLAVGTVGTAGVACRNPDLDGDDTGRAGRDAGRDTGIGGRDTGRDSGQDTGADTGQADSGQPDAGQDVGTMMETLSKPPFTQVTGRRSVRVRFETHTAAPLAVRLERMSGMGTETKAMTSTRKVDFEWPIDPTRSLKVEHRDLPGTYTVQEATFEGLNPGERYRWVLHLGGGVEVSGEIRVPPPIDSGFRMGWIADTMFPKSGEVGPRLAAQQADIQLHGGDIQYQSNPFDTYNGMFQALSGAMQTAPMHFCVGNHEYERQNEFELFFERLFSTRSLPYHAFTYGGVRFILANSEAEFGPGTDQFKWLQSELEAAKKDPMIRYPVVAFHRPFFTFSKSAPSLTTRDQFHPLFRDAGVPLVLTGHNHCYERFEADGVTYVVDGGGGALSYPTDKNKMKVLMQRPEDAGRRKAVDPGYGVTTVDFKPDGTMALRRVNDDGKEADSVTLG